MFVLSPQQASKELVPIRAIGGARCSERPEI
jgi:hypothetical protein